MRPRVHWDTRGLKSDHKDIKPLTKSLNEMKNHRKARFMKSEVVVSGSDIIWEDFILPPRPL